VLTYPAIFHMASSGGTILSRLLMVSYEVVVANEVHPFNLGGRFNPAFPIGAVQGQVSFSVNELATLWGSQLRIISRIARRKSKDSKLVLRIHSHSDYFLDCPHSRLALGQPSKESVVTVRNPLTNYYSAVGRGFIDVSFKTWLSRFQEFLDDYSDLEVFRFEDLMLKPKEEMPKLAEKLSLKERTLPRDVSNLPEISGDNREQHPITGTDFETKEKDNLEKILSDKFRCKEIRANLEFLNCIQERLGYSLTATSLS